MLMFEVLMFNTIDNWYRRIAIFGTKTAAISFLNKVGLNLILDYSERRPLIEIKIREINWEKS